MKKTSSPLLNVALFAAVLALFGGLCWFDFHVWRLKHPTAPAWTYFVP